MMRQSVRLRVVYLVAALSLAVLAANAGFVGTAAAANTAPNCATMGYDGAGNEGDPWQVGNVEQLQCIDENHDGADDRSDALNSHYVLDDDVDAGGTEHWNGGDGFDPIGDDVNEFTGSLDGQGHTISNLAIDRPSSDRVGLFGQVGADGSVANATLDDGSITGDTYVGGLVGWNEGDVTAANSTVNVSGIGRVGGLVGNNEGTVAAANATGTVTGTGNGVGGLVGLNNDVVANSSTTGDVTGEGVDVGGLVGLSNPGSSIDRSYATGDVNGGSEDVGGLVGESNGGIVTNSTASGDVTGDHERVGGLVGYKWKDSDISRSYATGTVNGNVSVGGLVGNNFDGDIDRSYATGTVDGDEDVGGLVGYSQGDIDRSYATGAVDGTSNVGGLLGRNDAGTVEDAYWDVNTTNQPTSDGGTGLTTEEMTGGSATTNMTGFDFGGTWTTTDSYPVLRWSVADYAVGLDSTALVAGDTMQASATVTLVDGRTVGASTLSTFGSTDRTVASVAGRTVTAEASGTAAIQGSFVGRSDAVALDVTAPASGGDASTPDPPTPDIAIDDASLSDTSIEPGASTWVSVTLGNEGDGDGIHEVALLVDDETVDSTNVFVAAGGSQSISFSQTFETAGEYAIAADNTTVGTVTVAEQGQSTETLARTDGDQSTDEPTPTETATESPTASPSSGGTPTPDDGGLPIPLIFASLLIVAILAAGGLLWAREQ